MTAPIAAPALRDDRIRLAAEICQSRSYTVDLDNPAFISLQVVGVDYDSAWTAARLACAALMSVSLPASRGTPLRGGPRDWPRSEGYCWYATITVRVGQ